MTHSWPEVNAAVLAVLGEVGRSSQARRDGRPSNGRIVPDVFVEKLFSLRHAEAIGDGAGEIRVAPGTVVTPLALDHLKRRRIAVRVVSGREASSSRIIQKGEWGFAIESKAGTTAALRRIMLDDWLEVGPDALNAARWVVDGEGRGAFVLTDESSVATWRTSQIPGVRSATVEGPEAVSRAIRHLGANLIVAEAAGKSIYLLKQIGERFKQGGAPTLPHWLEAEARP